MKQIKILTNILVIALLGTSFTIKANDGLTQLQEKPQIVELVDYFLDNNPRLIEQKANVNKAYALYQGANKAIYNPEISYEYEETDIKEYSIGLEQTIDLANKRGKRTKAAEYQYQATQEEHQDLRLELTAELLKSLAKQEASQSVHQILNKQSELMKEFLNLSQKRSTVGDIGEDELGLAKLAQANVITQLYQSEIEWVEAKETLHALIGKSVMNWPNMPTQLPPIQSGVPAYDELTQEHPKLKSAHLQLQSAKAEIKLAERERWPDPTVGIRGGKEDDEDLWGFEISLPLFIRNTYKDNVTASNEEAIAQEKRMMNLYQEKRAALESAWRRYHAYYQAWNKWQKNGAPTLRDRLKLLEKLWKSGDLETTDYLVQVQQSMEAQVSQEELRLKTWLAWIEWLNASGNVEQWLETLR